MTAHTERYDISNVNPVTVTVAVALYDPRKSFMQIAPNQSRVVTFSFHI